MTRHHIPVLRPLLPTAAEIRPYLERIDAARWYTNFGPLAAELEQRLADHYQISADKIVLVANGTLALAAALATAPPGHGTTVPMPSWTFPATALAAMAIGVQPCFLDVNPVSWALEPNAIPQAIAHRSWAAMPVAPFGAPPDLHGWAKWSESTDVSVVFDAATSFDSLTFLTLPDDPPLALAVSLHATKAFGVGEGGFVMSNDPEWILRIRRHINFGFYGARRSDVLGTNAKLSEFAAAVGLAGLDTWTDVRHRWLDVARQFSRRIADLSLHAQPGFGDAAVSTCVVEFENSDICERAITALETAGIDTRRWWGYGQHENPALAGVERTDLEATRSLARRTVGLPFWLDISTQQVDAIFSVVAKVLGR